jgi:acyl-CoA thioesterase I
MRIALSSILLLVLALGGCQAATEPSPPATDRPTAAATEDEGVSGPQRRILAFGDSLFAGLGVGMENSYPAQLEAALRKDGINVRIANAGVSGDTTAAGRQRLAFTLDAQKPPPDLVLLELGANDMLRALDPAETRANLTAMLDELARRKIPVLLMGMRAPPNYGADYQQAFDGIYAELGRRPGVTLVPFWLETIYRRPELFQADRLHPTTEGLGVLVADTKDAVKRALPPKT